MIISSRLRPIPGFTGMPENRRTPQNTTKHRKTPQNTAEHCRTPQDAVEKTAGHPQK